MLTFRVFDDYFPNPTVFSSVLFEAQALAIKTEQVEKTKQTKRNGLVDYGLKRLGDWACGRVFLLLLTRRRSTGVITGFWEGVIQ
jgi:hypothetical protein